MTVMDYMNASMAQLYKLSPLLMILSALGLADKIVTFTVWLVRQARESIR